MKIQALGSRRYWGDRYFDAALAATHGGRTPEGSWHEALQHSGALDRNGADHKRLALFPLLFGRGDGAPDELGDGLGTALWQELERGQGLCNRLAAHEVNNEPHLARSLIMTFERCGRHTLCLLSGSGGHRLRGRYLGLLSLLLKLLLHLAAVAGELLAW